VRYNIFGGGAQLWSPWHDLLDSFDHLCRNRSFVCDDSGMDRASMDPKALSGQKPKRSALHRCRYRIGRECWTRRFGRLANRGGAWLYRVRDRPKGEDESIQRDVDSMNLWSSIAVTAAMLVAHPTAAQELRDRPRPDRAREFRCLRCALAITARHGQPTFSTYRRMRAAECRTSGPYLRKPRAVSLYLSRKHDHAVQMDTRESTVKIVPQMRQR
jgi:hypothetical protein